MSEGIKIKEATHEEKDRRSSSRAKPASKKELLAKMEEAEKNSSENHDKYLRSCAELENYKKRAARDRENFIKYGNETIIKDILPTVDSMERALKHASDSEDLKAFVDGLGLIRDRPAARAPLRCWSRPSTGCSHQLPPHPQRGCSAME